MDHNNVLETDASADRESSYDGPDLLDPTRDWPVSTAYPFTESAGHLLRPSTSWEDRLEPLARQGPFSWELTPEVEVVFQVGKPKLANEKVVRVECLRLPEETVVVSPWGTTKTLREEGLYKVRYPVASRLDHRWDLDKPVRFVFQKRGAVTPALRINGGRMPTPKPAVPGTLKAQFRLPDGFMFVSPTGLPLNLHRQGHGIGISPGLAGDYSFFVPANDGSNAHYRRKNLGNTLFRATFDERMFVMRENTRLTAQPGLYELRLDDSGKLVVRDDRGQQRPRREINAPTKEFTLP
ncbi:mother-specific HO expression [Hypoxylon texense]